MDTFYLHEQKASYPSRSRILERLLHCIWSEQLFRKTVAVEGKQLLISSPGWWNLEAGPDFRNAELFLDGVHLLGDVEIHLNSSDWYRHGHQDDPRYNRVVLHVVLYSSHIPCKKQNGEPVPELVMKDSLLEELRILQQRLPIYRFPFGPDTNARLCRTFLADQDDAAVEHILDSAGDERMRTKKDRFLEVMKESDFAQAFYEFLMEGMGYKQSRYAFRELARRVPLKELIQFDRPDRKGIDAMASVLLGTAGLLHDFSQIRLQPPDPETSHYIDQLFSFWSPVAHRFRQRELTGFSWYPSSTRPANFPARRLTAVVAFFHYNGADLDTLFLQPMIQTALDRKGTRMVLRRWLELFSRPLHIYWSYHYQFERFRFIAPRRLIGIERGKILTVNVVLPALLAFAQSLEDRPLEERLHLLYRRHPRLCDNSITRLMEHRLFGQGPRARRFIHSAHRQQALHHFFYDFCDNNEGSCSRCELRGGTWINTEQTDSHR